MQDKDSIIRDKNVTIFFLVYVIIMLLIPVFFKDDSQVTCIDWDGTECVEWDTRY